MSQELKAYCVHCGGGIEFPSELQGQKIVCPHCNVLTTLGEPHPTVYKKAEFKRKSELIGGGCLVQGIGLLVIWIFPIGTVAGIILLMLGSRMAIKTICSNCGNRVANKQVRICPSCQSEFHR